MVGLVGGMIKSFLNTDKIVEQANLGNHICDNLKQVAEADEENLVVHYNKLSKINMDYCLSEDIGSKRLEIGRAHV